MLRRWLTVLGLVAALAPAASAQTIDDIINKNIAARGGLDKLKSIQTVRMSGKMSVGPGFEAPLTMEMKRPNSMRMSFTLQGLTGIQAYDGTNGWAVMPFSSGKKDPEAMSADDIKEIADQADIDGPLVDYKAKGNTVELLGKESVEGTDAWKIKVTLKSGTVRTLFIDADSYLEIRGEGKRMMRGTEMEYEGSIGDYKAVDGVMFPYSIENGVKGHPEKQKITFDKIEVNPTLAADLFTMPAKSDSSATAAKGDVKAQAAGDAKTADATAAAATAASDTTKTATAKTVKKTSKKSASKP
ncbi:MAG TPA: hypothetical protein VL123_06425 [Candidatus Udaeobacter sp.]|jgi:hypothetical protein|nr:hypothetical protein [Candidatus Udaeobacter sp.]